MTGYLLLNRKTSNNASKIDKSYIWIYIVFSILMGGALLINGEYGEYEFTKKFLAFNFVSIIAYLALDKFITNENRFRQFVFLLLLLIIIDDVVTILQYLKNPIGWAIGFVFGDIDKFADRAANNSIFLGKSITPGIFGHVVNNAFYIGMATPLCFALISDKRNFINIIFVISVFTLSLIAVYMTQQRMSFYLLVLSLCIFCVITLKKRPFLLVCVLILSIFISFTLEDNPSEVDYGRLAQTEDSARELLIENAVNFIGDHPLWGGPMKFQEQAGLSSHNIVFDSYIFSGLFGFLVMMFLWFKTICKSVSRMRVGFKSKENNYIILFTSYSLVSCMIYGLTHNASYLTGEVMVFILLALTLKVEKLIQ